MTIEQALITKLLTVSALTALIGQRVYYVGRTPQDVTLPYVVIQTIDDLPDHNHQGNSNLYTVRIQVNAFASTYLGCKAVDAAILAGIDSQYGTWSGLAVNSCLAEAAMDFDNSDDPNISGIHRDYIIQYNI
jgi:hypothetical protein